MSPFGVDEIALVHEHSACSRVVLVDDHEGSAASMPQEPLGLEA